MSTGQVGLSLLSLEVIFHFLGCQHQDLERQLAKLETVVDDDALYQDFWSSSPNVGFRDGVSYISTNFLATTDYLY